MHDNSLDMNLLNLLHRQLWLFYCTSHGTHQYEEAHPEGVKPGCQVQLPCLLLLLPAIHCSSNLPEATQDALLHPALGQRVHARQQVRPVLAVGLTPTAVQHHPADATYSQSRNLTCCE